MPQWTNLAQVLGTIYDGLFTGKGPDGKPWSLDHGVCTTKKVVPVAGGTPLPASSVKYLTLLNYSGAQVSFALSGGEQVPLLPNQAQPLPVSDAGQVTLFNADNADPDDDAFAVHYIEVV